MKILRVLSLSLACVALLGFVSCSSNAKKTEEKVAEPEVVVADTIAAEAEVVADSAAVEAPVEEAAAE